MSSIGSIGRVLRAWALALERRRYMALAGIGLVMPLVATGVLAVSQLQRAAAHRAAVVAGARQVAGVMLRDTYDLILSQAFRSGRTIHIAGNQGGADVQAVIGHMIAAADSVRDCRCGPWLPIEGVFVWSRGDSSVAGSEGLPASNAELRRRLAGVDADVVASDPARLYVAVGPAGGDGWLLLLNSRDGGDAIRGVVVDLASLGDAILDPIRRSIGQTYGGRAPWFADSIRLRIAVPSGRDVYSGGTATGSLVRYGLPLFGDEQMVRSATPDRWFEGSMELGPAAVAALIPGGLPASPAPLVGSVLVLAALLSAVGVVLLFRVRQTLAIREQFVAGVSHDLRTPLTKILVYAETLELNRPVPEVREEAGRVIAREARRLIQLSENALAFVRGQRPSSGLSVEPTDLAVAAQAAIDRVRSRGMTSHDVVFQNGARIVAQVDAAGFGQIVQNLVDNALRYSGPGTVLVALQTQGGMAELSVSDPGPAIPPADRRRIFAPFVRLDPDGADGGTGLGLAIVEQMARLHGGSIALTTTPAGGNRFTVQLPLADAGDPRTAES